MRRLAALIALLALGLLVLAPVATMVVESVRADAVERVDGSRVLGHISKRAPDGVTIRAFGETTNRHVPGLDVARVDRVFTLGNYAGLGRRGDMFLATLALGGLATLVALLIGLPFGLLVAATDLPGRRWFELLGTLPLVLPPILVAIATYHDMLAVRPEFLRAVLVFGFCLFPLVSLFVARAVRATGGDALDAARLQATPREALLRIALRPALPGAAAGALLVFAFVVADFAVPDFLGVTTAKNTITVYANAVFRAWNNDGDPATATAMGMPPTVLAIAALGAVFWLERRRGAATLGGAFREPEPTPLGRARWPAFGAAALLLVVVVAWPMVRHIETAGGKHFGNPVALQGAGAAQVVDDARSKPASVADGLRKGLRHTRVGKSTRNSLVLAGGGALLAVLVALLLTEVGLGFPRLDALLLAGAFLPVAVPAMSLAVGWVRLVGPERASLSHAPILLLAARLLPFATLAVRAARRRIRPELFEAAAVAGLPPAARFARVALPLALPGVALGFLLAFLFGLREVDALVFTRTGAETLPVQLYNMIHYGYDVQVAGLSFLWTAGVALLLVLVALVAGPRFRLLP